MDMNFFSGRSRCCSQCSRREITVGGEKVTEYYHRGVVCYLIGYDIPVPLDIEMYGSQEGELTAAKRLVERVCRLYPRYFDAFIGDAIYLTAPIVNLCQDHHKHVVAVLKNNNRDFLKDAEGVFKLQPPEFWKGDREIIRYWDEEGFTSFEGVSVPMRVIRAEETLLKRRRRNHQWVETSETHYWSWATTIPTALLPSRQLWEAGHGRWEIENRLFHHLVTYWSMDHCFKHDPKAIVNFILTLFIAFVMFQCFYLRNLKASLRKRFTAIALAREMLVGLLAMKNRAPWLIRIRGPGP